jgi:probable rRNA maturation factor
MKSSSTLTIQNKTKSTLPGVPFAKMKDVVLGKKYELSLVFVGAALSKKLNNAYRGKNKPTNILSFSISKTEGEIFINSQRVKTDAPKFGRTEPGMLAFLFIHGMLHLKGMEHGSKMEREERKFCKRFKI